jgi:hypothetical protein
MGRLRIAIAVSGSNIIQQADANFVYAPCPFERQK